MAEIKSGKINFRFCLKCHKIHIVGQSREINDKIARQLRDNFGKWDAELCVCEPCLVEVSDEDILLPMSEDTES